jgi:hypothetical protein
VNNYELLAENGDLTPHLKGFERLTGWNKTAHFPDDKIDPNKIGLLLFAIVIQ